MGTNGIDLIRDENRRAFGNSKQCFLLAAYIYAGKQSIYHGNFLYCGVAGSDIEFFLFIRMVLMHFSLEITFLSIITVLFLPFLLTT